MNEILLLIHVFINMYTMTFLLWATMRESGCKSKKNNICIWIILIIPSYFIKLYHRIGKLIFQTVNFPFLKRVLFFPRLSNDRNTDGCTTWGKLPRQHYWFITPTINCIWTRWNCCRRISSRLKPNMGTPNRRTIETEILQILRIGVFASFSLQGTSVSRLFEGSTNI